jgi:predicted amidohydrolase
MKVACLQFAPEVGKVEENVARAEKVLQNTHLPDDLDWLVLPELAFTGMSACRGQRAEGRGRSTEHRARGSGCRIHKNAVRAVCIKPSPQPCPQNHTPR